MEIEYKGANCVVIKDHDAVIVVDPTSNVSVKEANNPDAVILSTQAQFTQGEREAKNFVIDMPGEYEHKDISVRGLPVHVHTDKDGTSGTMYQLETKDAHVAIIGHTDAPLSDDDLETLGLIDILIIPIGGGGYTLDARDAATIVRQISPKIVIPTHFADSAIKYPVPQDSVDEFVKQIGGAYDKKNILKLKGSLPNAMTVVELSRTA